MPHLEHILSDIENYKLEKWDPDIALNGYKTVLAVLKTQKDDDAKSKAKDILGKIAKLDAVEAFKIKG